MAVVILSKLFLFLIARGVLSETQTLSQGFAPITYGLQQQIQIKTWVLLSRGYSGVVENGV